MRPESTLWSKLRPILRAAKLDPVRVENAVCPGTPDVNFIGGWIELKSVPEWPVRKSTHLKIGHYTPQQRVWLYQRWKYAPGSTFLLLEVRSVKQCLLFDGDVAAKVVGRSTTSAHRIGARAVIDADALTELPKILSEAGRTVRRRSRSARSGTRSACPVRLFVGCEEGPTNGCAPRCRLTVCRVSSTLSS